MKVSVIIPTYRDWPRLLLCLDAIAQQTLPRGEFEILVVDNDAVHAPPSLPDGVRCVHQPEGFSYAARNAGARLALAEVLAFTDADCLPAADWLASGLAALAAQPECGLVAGRIDVFSDVENGVVRYETLFEFQQEIWVKRMHFGATANLFVRRVAYDAAQGFNDTMKSGGDSDFCRRCVALGWPIGYADAVRIRHPSRRTMTEVLQKNRRIAAGFYGHWLRDNGGRRDGLWRQLPWWWRLRLREWLYILTGARGSRRYTMGQRFTVLYVHVVLHYHTAWCLLTTHLTRGRSHHDVR